MRASPHDRDVRAARGEHVSPSDCAFTYARLADREHTLEWLQRACDEHASIMLELGGPIFDEIRDAPEFRTFVRRLQVPTIATKP
jgi:hypothetical protein